MKLETKILICITILFFVPSTFGTLRKPVFLHVNSASAWRAPLKVQTTAELSQLVDRLVPGYPGVVRRKTIKGRDNIPRSQIAFSVSDPRSPGVALKADLGIFPAADRVDLTFSVSGSLSGSDRAAMVRGLSSDETFAVMDNLQARAEIKRKISALANGSWESWPATRQDGRIEPSPPAQTSEPIAFSSRDAGTTLRGSTPWFTVSRPSAHRRSREGSVRGRDGKRRRLPPLSLSDNARNQ